MNIWLLFAVLAPFFYALVNIIDKFILEKRITNFYVYAVVTGFSYVIPISIIYYFVGLPSIDQKTAMIVLLVGTCYGIIHFLYYYVMTKYEVSRVVGLFYVYPVFVALLSFLFIGERLTPLHYIAILVAIGGTFFLGTEKQKNKWRLSHLFWLMLIGAILPAVIDVSDKYLLGKFSYWEVYLLVTIPAAVISILPIFSKNVRRDLSQVRGTVSLVLLMEALAFGGAFAFLRAAALAPISIVSAFGTLQPVFVFVITILFSRFLPAFLKETLNHHVLLHKSAGIALIVVAAVILSLA